VPDELEHVSDRRRNDRAAARGRLECGVRRALDRAGADQDCPSVVPLGHLVRTALVVAVRIDEQELAIDPELPEGLLQRHDELVVRLALAAVVRTGPKDFRFALRDGNADAEQVEVDAVRQHEGARQAADPFPCREIVDHDGIGVAVRGVELGDLQRPARVPRSHQLRPPAARPDGTAHRGKLGQREREYEIDFAVA
jgi:hypothetical protein